MTDPVAGTHDQALIHWMEQHRAHVLQLVYHVIYTIHVLPDGDQHALEAAIAEREGLARVAAEVARHLSDADLHNTGLWRRYVGLEFGDSAAELWRAVYHAGGADGVKRAAITELEAAAAELENPPAPSVRALRQLEEVYWFPDAAQHMHELIQHTRDALTTLGHHPHDDHARDAVRQAWTTLTQAGAEVARRLEDARDSELHTSPHYLLKPSMTWTQITLDMYEHFVADATSASAVEAAALDGRHDIAISVRHLEHVLWLLAGYVNGADPR
jgi:hypothetical protein